MVQSSEKPMRKGQMAVWAVATFALAWVLFALAMPHYNRANNTGDMGRAYGFLLIPVAVQFVLLACGAIYSTRRKHPEVVFGILFGFGLEFAALFVLIIISATAHY
jgi:ABC-type transport system involved in multi-copper enzyme maturation permease subunit